MDFVSCTDQILATFLAIHRHHHRVNVHTEFISHTFLLLVDLEIICELDTALPTIGKFFKSVRMVNYVFFKLQNARTDCAFTTLHVAATRQVIVENLVLQLEMLNHRTLLAV